MPNNILILTNGVFYNGGYSTLAKKIHNVLISRGMSSKIYSFVFNEENNRSYHIHVNIEQSKNIDYVKTKMDAIFGEVDYHLIICTSPWSFYFSSVYFRNRHIIYFKGGGLNTTDKITELKNKYILETNIDEYFDQLTLELENKAILNTDKYLIIPTTKMMRKMLSTSVLNFDQNKLVDPLNYLFFDKYHMKIKSHKKYDLIVVISDHKRIVKNSNFCYEVFNKLSHLNKIVIGDNCENYRDVSNTKVINYCIRSNKLYNYFDKSKIILIPSYYDTGPSTFIEALLRGCIPICYQNCGFSEFDIGAIKMIDLNIINWTKKINRLLSSFDKINSIEINQKINSLIDTDGIQFIKMIEKFMCHLGIESTILI